MFFSKHPLNVNNNAVLAPSCFCFSTLPGSGNRIPIFPLETKLFTRRSSWFEGPHLCHSNQCFPMSSDPVMNTQRDNDPSRANQAPAQGFACMLDGLSVWGPTTLDPQGRPCLSGKCLPGMRACQEESCAGKKWRKKQRCDNSIWAPVSSDAFKKCLPGPFSYMSQLFSIFV